MNASSSLVLRLTAAAVVAVAIAAAPVRLMAQTAAVAGSNQAIGELSVAGGPPVPIYRFSFDIQQPGGTGGGAGAVVLSDVAIVKLPDALSTLLFRSTLQGARLTAVRIDLFDSGRNAVASTFELSDVLVSSFVAGGDQGEAVKFRFGQLVFSAAGQSFCWNNVSGSPC